MFRQPHSGFNRVPFVQTCTIEWDGVRTSCMVCNLSILGVYLHLEAPLEAGRKVTVRFRLPDQGPEIQAEAMVSWLNVVPPAGATGLPLGCGVRFLRVPPADLRRIAAVVADFLAAPREQVQVGIEQPFTGRVRIPFIAECTLTGRFGTRHGNVCNLSIVGVYVAMNEIPAVGARGQIRFQMPGNGGEFASEFKVAWQNPAFPNRVHALPPGCGLRFENLGESEAKVLAGFVQEYLMAVADSA